MKNILVYLEDGVLAPKGGPVGYNYHLKKQLEKMGVQNIHYIHSNGGTSQAAKDIVSKIKNSKIQYVAKIVKSVLKKSTYLYGFRHKSIVDLTPYDIVHFHLPMDMYMARDSLKNYKGKVVLTSHTPTVSSKEIYDLLTLWEKKYMNWFYKKLIEIDRYAFSRADYIIFPCPDAEEPYYNNWSEYASIKEQKKESYRYLLTGTEKRFAKRTRAEVCKEYGIPEDAFILCYAGRHNEIKGYDSLKEIGAEVLAKYPNACFLIAGKEFPLEGLDDERWIEVGWTTDPHSLIAASDAFILPNKETYFDLIMLEVLSLGKIVVASSTGGNKYFEKIGAAGVMTYKSKNEALSLIDKLHDMPLEEKYNLEKNNLKLFEECFCLDVFGKNYVELINSL